MLIDCDACGVRGPGCADCVISALMGAPPKGVELAALPAGVELEGLEVRPPTLEDVYLGLVGEDEQAER